MTDSMLLLVWLAAAPDLSLLAKVEALSKAPSAPRVHALMESAVDRQKLIDRILMDATEIDGEARARLGRALLRSLELRASRGLAGGAFSCDRSAASQGKGDDGIPTLRIKCARGDKTGMIELYVSGEGRAYDAAIDGALLSRNLRAQINKGLRTHGLEEVIRRLEAP